MCNPNPPPNAGGQLHQQQPPQYYLDPFLSSPQDERNEPQLTSTTPFSFTDVVKETKSLVYLAFPMTITSLIVQSRSIISTLFLGRLGDLELAGGSLGLAFANITGYSVLSGLALGMEPLCSQTFGAGRPKLLSVTLHRCVIFLLLCSLLPITFLWCNISTILSFFGQDTKITSMAHTYLMFSLPDLFTNSLIHPIRIYLRAQRITYPLTLASLVTSSLHLPMSFLFVTKLQLGVAGVAAASAASNFFGMVILVLYVWARGLHVPTWTTPSWECLKGWWPLLRLAGPSCMSVCLEWWWYEIMFFLCGRLRDPKATVASMGVLMQTTGFIYVFPSSLGFAVSTRVGNELGANRPSRAKLSARVAVALAFFMSLSAVAFANGMRCVWGWMFTSDPKILRLTSLALPILGFCELGNCLQTVMCGVLRGSARPTTAANVNLGSFYLVGMPVAVGLAFCIRVGFNGLWIGLLSAQICCALSMLCVLVFTDWGLQAKRAQELSCVGCEAIQRPPSPSSDSDGEEVQPPIKITVSSP